MTWQPYNLQDLLAPQLKNADWQIRYHIDLDHGWTEWSSLVPRPGQTLRLAILEKRDLILAGSNYQMRWRMKPDPLAGTPDSLVG